MAYSDLKGLAVSTSSSEALHAYERGLDLFLRWRGGAMDALERRREGGSATSSWRTVRGPYIAWRMGQVDRGRASAAPAGQWRWPTHAHARARALARADR